MLRCFAQVKRALKRLDQANEKLAARQARLDQCFLGLRKYISAKLAVVGYRFWDPGGLKTDHVIGPQISAMHKHATSSPFMFDDEPRDCIRVLDLCAKYSSTAKYYLNHKAYDAKSVHVMAIDIDKDLEDLLKMQFTAEQFASIEVIVDDLTRYTRARIEGLLSERWGCTLDDVHHIHWSPPCTTHSGM